LKVEAKGGNSMEALKGSHELAPSSKGNVNRVKRQKWGIWGRFLTIRERGYQIGHLNGVVRGKRGNSKSGNLKEEGKGSR